MPESNTKITYGISGVRAWAITSIGSDGFPVYSATAIDWKGAREITTKPKGEDTVIYGDNIEYVILNGTKSIDGNFTALTMPNGIKQSGLGYVEDLNKAMIVNAAAKSELGLIYEVEIINESGANDKELHTIYRAMLSNPEETNKTYEGKGEGKEFSVPFQGFEVVDTANDLTYVESILKKSVVGDTIYNAAKAAIYKPDTVA